jgi:transcriptional regulator with GAF, ATPase, and Fis domain
MSNILQHQEILRLKEILSDDNTYLQQQMVKMSGDTVIGADTGLRGVMEMVRQVARLDSPVLLLGETGVGKEVIANALHYSSKRKDGAFIKVKCGAIPDSLIDSELFGHEKGAFTGAISRKRGRFERAHGGTIFLDEVGELPPAAQVRLLRVVQHREIERVGGTETIPVDVRIISATHRNMEEQVRSGKFREDLWYRLNVFPIMIPPLRQRVEDIPALAEHFLEMKSKELKIGKIPTASGDVIHRLANYHWPGNVRELENFVERALIRGKLETGDIFPSEERPASITDDKRGTQTITSLDKAMAAHIQKALDVAGGRIHGPKGAARILEVNPSTLRSRMLKLGIHHKHPSKS